MIEVWGIKLDGILWFCVSGASFFVGCVLLIGGVLFALRASRLWHNILIYFALIIAILFVYMAAIPFSNTFYIVWTTAICGALLAVHMKMKKRSMVTMVALGMTLLAVCIELPSYVMPSFESQGYNRIFVIGDSISDGIGAADERTWPKIVAENGFDVIDVAKAGATTVTAIRRQVHKVTDQSGIVVLEIGGNDALMGTPLEEYEKALREILTKVAISQHAVVMLEVPTLPWHIDYGRIQRKVAAEFNVTLIPKKFLAGIFSAKDATQDLAHLSAKGHELMAQKILSIIDQPVH
jgi:lysophospholipase L1-like esterase